VVERTDEEKKKREKLGCGEEEERKDLLKER
jgi:hypothetical protein